MLVKILKYWKIVIVIMMFRKKEARETNSKIDGMISTLWWEETVTFSPRLSVSTNTNPYVRRHSSQ